MKNFFKTPKFLIAAFAAIALLFSFSAFANFSNCTVAAPLLNPSVSGNFATAQDCVSALSTVGSFSGSTIQFSNLVMSADPTLGTLDATFYGWSSSPAGYSDGQVIPVSVTFSTAFDACFSTIGQHLSLTGQYGLPNTGCYLSCTYDIISGVGLSDGTWSGEGVGTGVSCVGDTAGGGTAPPATSCPAGQILVGGSCYTPCSSNPSIPSVSVNCNAPPASGVPPVGPPVVGTPDPCIAAGTCTPANDPCIALGTCSGTGTGPGGTAGGGGYGNGTGTSNQDLINYLNSANVSGHEGDLNGAMTDSKTAVDGAINDSVVGAYVDAGPISRLFYVNVSSQTCSTFQGNVHGYPVNIDICPYTEMIRSLLAWLFGLFTAYTIFHIIFRPRS